MTSSNLNWDNMLSAIIDLWKVLPNKSEKKSGQGNTGQSSIDIWNVHPTYCRYICIIHSPEGVESVGLQK